MLYLKITKIKFVWIVERKAVFLLSPSAVLWMAWASPGGNESPLDCTVLKVFSNQNDPMILT